MYKPAQLRRCHAPQAKGSARFPVRASQGKLAFWLTLTEQRLANLLLGHTMCVNNMTVLSQPPRERLDLHMDLTQQHRAMLAAKLGLCVCVCLFGLGINIKYAYGEFGKMHAENTI